MSFQTITKESELKKRLEELKKDKESLEKEINQVEAEIKVEHEKNRKRRPSRFL